MSRIDLAALLAGVRDTTNDGGDPPRSGTVLAAGAEPDAVAVAALACALGNTLAHRHAMRGGETRAGEAVRVAAQAVCLADAAGHACLPLAELATPERDLDAWRTSLAASPVVAAPHVDQADVASKPLVLDAQDRLYTQRYWRAENALATRWVQWQHDAPLTADHEAARAVLNGLFPAAPGGEPDAQKTAVALALLRPALVLSGGPGTGKTTTVVRLLAALAQLAPALDVALVAPTGKAAARMQESLRLQLAALPLPDAARVRLPQTARTVHALLGIGPDATRPRHHRDHPLGADVVIVDEASMLGLMLAARLFDALKPGARIVLVGDRDQLASVESGIVLATLAQAQRFSPALAETLAALGAPVAPDHIAAQDESPTTTRDAVVWLTRSHRFGDASGIGRVAAAVQGGSMPALAAALSKHADVSWPGAGSPSDIATAALDGYAEYLDAVRERAAPAVVLACFDRYRMLTALREGSRGAAGINAAIAQRVRLALDAPGAAAWYHGRPVIVTRNDALLQVFNGDVGVCLAETDGRLLVHFRRPDGSLRTYAPGRLDACEDAYAMTVHKAQGSEFDGIDVVLPTQPSRVVVRELIYTAFTRARRTLRLWSPEDVLAAGVSARTTRHSGLAERLREQADRTALGTKASP